MRLFHFLTWLVHSHKRWLFFVWSIIVVWFLWSDVGFAAPDNPPKTSELTPKQTIDIINNILWFVSVILGLVSMLIGAMIHPNWTSGDIVWLGGENGVLKQMWIFVSNVVYFVFALIFVGIAFLTIYKWESYAIKDKLPRFIAWVLIVPFSWFLVQFIISISSLLTYAVLALPFDTMNTVNPEEMQKLQDKTVMCKEMTINTTPGNKTPISPDPKNCEWSSKVKLSEILDYKTDDWFFGIMTIYTYGIFEIQNAHQVILTDAGSIVKTLLALSAASLFDLLFIVVYMLIMIALTLALFVRWVYMWAYAMFSPVFWLLWFFGKEKEWTAEGKFGIMQFIHLALVPVYVGSALSFGLVFIFVSWTQNYWKDSSSKGFGNNGVLNIGSSVGTNKDKDGNKITSANKKDEIYNTKLEFIKKEGADKATSTITLVGPQGTYLWAMSNETSLLGGLKTYTGPGWKLLLRLFWLAFLYMTVMLALKSSKVTESIADPFQKFGESIWNMVAKAPINTPMIPTGTKHGTISLAWLQNVWQKLEQAAVNAWRQSADGFWDDLVKNLFPNLNKSIQNLSNAAISFANAWNKFTDESLKQLEPELKNMDADTWNRIKNNPQIRKMLEALYWADVVKLDFEQAKTRISGMTTEDIKTRITQNNKDLNVTQIGALAQSAKSMWSQSSTPSTPPSSALSVVGDASLNLKGDSTGKLFSYNDRPSVDFTDADSQNKVLLKFKSLVWNPSGKTITHLNALLAQLPNQTLTDITNHVNVDARWSITWWQS